MERQKMDRLHNRGRNKTTRHLVNIYSSYYTDIPLYMIYNILHNYPICHMNTSTFIFSYANTAETYV